jgi:hypothetical protein
MDSVIKIGKNARKRIQRKLASREAVFTQRIILNHPYTGTTLLLEKHFQIPVTAANQCLPDGSVSINGIRYKSSQ